MSSISSASTGPKDELPTKKQQTEPLDPIAKRINNLKKEREFFLENLTAITQDKQSIQTIIERLKIPNAETHNDIFNFIQTQIIQCMQALEMQKTETYRSPFESLINKTRGEIENNQLHLKLEALEINHLALTKKFTELSSQLNTPPSEEMLSIQEQNLKESASQIAQLKKDIEAIELVSEMPKKIKAPRKKGRHKIEFDQRAKILKASQKKMRDLTKKIKLHTVLKEGGKGLTINLGMKFLSNVHKLPFLQPEGVSIGLNLPLWAGGATLFVTAKEKRLKSYLAKAKLDMENIQGKMGDVYNLQQQPITTEQRIKIQNRQTQAIENQGIEILKLKDAAQGWFSPKSLSELSQSLSSWLSYSSGTFSIIGNWVPTVKYIGIGASLASLGFQFGAYQAVLKQIEEEDKLQEAEDDKMILEYEKYRTLSESDVEDEDISVQNPQSKKTQTEIKEVRDTEMKDKKQDDKSFTPFSKPGKKLGNQ